MAIIGIDLGTTNSLVSYWKEGTVKLIPNSMGSVLTPSVVSGNAGGDSCRAIGKRARTNA